MRELCFFNNGYFCLILKSFHLSVHIINGNIEDVYDLQSFVQILQSGTLESINILLVEALDLLHIPSHARSIERTFILDIFVLKRPLRNYQKPLK